MNKSKRPMTAQLRKKMKKEVRSGALQPEPTLRSDTIKAGDLLSSLRPKAQKKGKAALKSIEKNLSEKKKKKSARHSRRATAATVDAKSAPQSVHIEGKRWIKSLKQQTSAKRKVMTRQMTKKGSK
jgi:hypothetical protein